MAITSLDTLLQGMIAHQSFNAYRLTIGAQVLGHEASLWRGSGHPAQGAIPTVPTVCHSSTVGACALAPRTAGQDRILAQIIAQLATVGACLDIEDRLMHMGGLNGTLTTAQTVGVDLNANLGNSNLAERIGKSDFSEIEWYLEWYVATGATSVTPSLQVTFADGTTGAAQIYALGATALPASVGASRRYKIYSTTGKPIRSIETVQLSASTGTVGNFGVTAIRRIASVTCSIANSAQVFDWSYLGAPKIYDNSCITFGIVCAATATGAFSCILKQAVA